MGKYLKLFENHTQYEEYITGETAVLPNVSHCINEAEVHYNPWVETRLVVYYDIQDISSPTTIFINNDNSVKSIEVDGKETISEFSQGNVTYQFDSVGEHIIKFEFHNPTVVGSNAPLFYNLTTIKRAVVADTFTSIGQNAFNSCSGLTSITIPNSVISIGFQAFTNCNGLTSVTIPNSVTSIGSNAFSGCSSITSIDIPDSVTSIGNGAFNKCSGLTSVTIGSGITSIGTSAFTNCNGLTSVTIPNSVTSIGSYAFTNCNGLTSVTIPNGVTTIGQQAFAGCSGLTSITSLATTAPTIDNYTFYNVKTGGTLTVPSGSSGYDTWMGTGNYYLGKYNWTKVEQ